MIRPEGIEEAMLCAAKKLAEDVPPYKTRELPEGYRVTTNIAYSDMNPTGDPAAIIASVQ
ncbi:MAG TPA: hypothetical protein PL105_18125 [Caldilineaceae bacterium]|nr:hypothetical protein [Caldilineaceae bacterium]